MILEKEEVDFLLKVKDMGDDGLKVYHSGKILTNICVISNNEHIIMGNLFKKNLIAFHDYSMDYIVLSQKGEDWINANE